MASADHAHNLEHIMGALVRFLRTHTDIEFEFFGSIPMPPEFQEFGSRIRQAPKIDNYEEFLQRFAEYEWDIGICPLTPIHFNMMKANTKWVEYTSVGAAVVASKGTVYDECCADGCGILADTEDEWFDALDSLARDPQARFEQVRRAQEKLARSYSTDHLREQVLDIFSQAHNLQIRSRLRESM
jgi:glycosyltransferase involved in cell wall biosynthesis